MNESFDIGAPYPPFELRSGDGSNVPADHLSDQVNQGAPEAHGLPTQALPMDPEVFPGVVVPSVEQEDRGIFARAKEWVGKHRGKLALGAAAVSLATTLVNNPAQEVMDKALEAAPWALGGAAVSETAFCVGGVMMLGAIGDKAKNPFKIKSKISEIAQKANDSKLFKTGFWVNTSGAVGTALFASGAVMAKMPVESWGVLSLAALDLSLTYAVRKAMRSGIRNNIRREHSAS